MYSGSVAASCTGGVSLPSFATKSTQSTSRVASVNSARSWGRWKTRTFSGGAHLAMRMASSSAGLYGMILDLPSRPQLAVRTTFGWASLMRFASSAAGKPPNTTPWMAPMRAHASMPKTVSGIIGM